MTASTTQPRFLVLQVVASAELADDVAYALMDLGSTGVEQRDQSTIEKGPSAHQVLIEASFDSEEARDEASTRLQASFVGLDVKAGEIVGDEWRDEYKKHFAPFVLTEGVQVVPPWQQEPSADGQVTLVMDPGRAFGTGLHATTSLVADQMASRREAWRGMTVLDAGTGSGILAFTALLLGAQKAHGFDVDADAVDVARRNARENDLESRVKLWAGGFQSVEQSYPVVFANIRTTILLAERESLTPTVQPGGWLVLSGILAREADSIKSAFGADFEFVERCTRKASAADADEEAWVAMVFKRPGGL